MSDNCIYADDFDSTSTCQTEVLRTARIPHKCEECCELIKPGDRYEVISGYDVEREAWWRHKTCARCVNVRTDFFRGTVLTCMVEDFREAHGFDYRDGIPADFTPCGAADR